MNLSLIDPFVLAQDYPDTLTEKLRMLLYLVMDWERLILTIKRKWPCDLFAIRSYRRLPSFWTSEYAHLPDLQSSKVEPRVEF